MRTDVLFSRESDIWRTPRALFDALHAEFKFTLDAAAGPENHLCANWRGPKHPEAHKRNALVFEWGSFDTAVFCNPPYSQCAKFVAKAHAEREAGCTVVLLVPARTDTRWWHEFVWDTTNHCPRPRNEVRFIKGRLKFWLSPEELQEINEQRAFDRKKPLKAENSAPFPSAIIVMRPI